MPDPTTPVTDPPADPPAGPPAGGDPPVGEPTIMAAPAPPPPPTSWRDDLPDDLKTNKSIEKFKDKAALAKGYVDLEKSSSRGDRILIPTKDSTDAERATFWEKIGRPVEAKGYELPAEGIPADVTLNDEQIAGFQKFAHEIGLSKEQYAACVRFDAQRQGTAMEGINTSAEEFKEQAEVELKKEYGDAYPERLEMANDALMHFGGQEAIDVLVDTGMANHPALVKMMVKVGMAVGQDEIMGGGHRVTYDKTPDEALAEMGRLKTDKEFMDAYVSKQHPGHEEAVTRMLKLQEAAHGTEVIGSTGGKQQVTG